MTVYVAPSASSPILLTHFKTKLISGSGGVMHLTGCLSGGVLVPRPSAASRFASLTHAASSSAPTYSLRGSSPKSRWHALYRSATEREVVDGRWVSCVTKLCCSQSAAKSTGDGLCKTCPSSHARTREEHPRPFNTHGVVQNTVSFSNRLTWIPIMCVISKQDASMDNLFRMLSV